MWDIMEIIDEREMQKTNTEKSKGVVQAIVKVWELNGFVARLGFFQLICKASLIFKMNLKLALSLVLKERGLYGSKHGVMEWSCLKICDLLSFLICFSILVLKWRQVSPM